MGLAAFAGKYAHSLSGYNSVCTKHFTSPISGVAIASLRKPPDHSTIGPIRSSCASIEAKL